MVFNGEDDLVKNEAPFDQWLFEVRAFQKKHTKASMREGIIRSLRGPPLM